MGKYSLKVKERISCGDFPQYRTKRGKLLWTSNQYYDGYSSAASCRILEDANRKFWGYSDNPNVRPIWGYFDEYETGRGFNNKKGGSNNENEMG